jgi:hypothetical protein
MGLSHRSRRGLQALAGATLVALIGLLCLRAGLGVDVVKRAAGIPNHAAGVGQFIDGAQALVLPALVIVAAICPLAIVAGGLSLMFGGRRGLQMIGTALGVLLLLGSVTAIVD